MRILDRDDGSALEEQRTSEKDYYIQVESAGAQGKILLKDQAERSIAII